MATSTRSRSDSARRSGSSRSKSSGNRSQPAKRSQGSSRSQASRSQANRSQASRSQANRSQASRRRTSGSRSAGRTSSGNGSSASPVEAVRDTVSSGAQSIASGAQSTGQAIGGAASKAKGPALTGGAALAGLVGGMAIARGGRRRVLGIPVPGTRRPLVKIKAPRRNNVAKDVVKAAGQMGSAGRQMAELATEVRLARQQIENGRRRSPIEVVLEGLTARRSRSG
jgi:hypothetical protein